MLFVSYRLAVAFATAFFLYMDALMPRGVTTFPAFATRHLSACPNAL
jgi:hypothetical protein